jgi:hypothetical protein
MDLLIKAETPFGVEDYQFSVRDGEPAVITFRNNKVEIHEYIMSNDGFYAVFDIDVPMTTSVSLYVNKNKDSDGYSGFAKIGKFATVKLTASVL